jgi:hypothetical protein
VQLNQRLGITGGPRAVAASGTASAIALVDTNPLAAVARARELPTDERVSATFEIGRRWGARDAEGAYGYASALPDGRERFDLLNGLFNVWADSNPRRVIEILEAGVSQPVRGSLVNYGIARMARTDPARTFAQLASMRNIAARDAALKVALLDWAQQDPEAAAAALATLDPPGREQELGPIVGAQFARRSPERALAWAYECDGRYGDTFRATLGEIGRQNPQQGIELANAVEPGQRRTMTIMVLGSIAQADPEAATRQWQRLPAEMRSDGAFQIVREGVQDDAAAAAETLASRVTLPPEVYDDIRTLLDGREPERRPRSTERQLRLQ